jgi:hypothetical protein
MHNPYGNTGNQDRIVRCLVELEQPPHYTIHAYAEEPKQITKTRKRENHSGGWKNRAFAFS